MLNSVELSADAYLMCLTHALTTEKEEVMGLLLGEIRENKVAYICSAYAMRRSDKRPDRVEISPEQLSAAAIEAETLANQFGRPIQVLGWYHSHPHITVWPSHVDVNTQASYQLLDPNFIGLIFSCFNTADKKSRLQLICFQSYCRTIPDEPTGNEHLELPLRVVATPQSCVSDMCVSAISHLPSILLEEERESYRKSQEQCEDFLTTVHNSGVFTQALSHLLQVVAAPLIQTLEDELARNKRTIEKLKNEKEQLLAILNPSTTSDTEV